MTGRIQADGRKAPVAADVALDMQRMSVARLLNRLDVDIGDLRHSLGQARGGVGLGGQGFSIKEILAHSNGEVELLMEGGQINRTIVAGLGLDLLRLFGSFVGATPEWSSCAARSPTSRSRDGIVRDRAIDHRHRDRRIWAARARST